MPRSRRLNPPIAFSQPGCACRHSVAPPSCVIARPLIRAAPCSVHLSESVEEAESSALAAAPGANCWRRAFLEAAWIALASPLCSSEDSGFLMRVPAVHGVQMTSADLSRLAFARRDARHLSQKYATARERRRLRTSTISGVHVAVGTDSLASAPDLSVFAELATLRAWASAGLGAAGERAVEGARSASCRLLARSSGRSGRGLSPLTFQLHDDEEYCVGDPPRADRVIETESAIADLRLIDSKYSQFNLKSAIRHLPALPTRVAAISRSSASATRCSLLLFRAGWRVASWA